MMSLEELKLKVLQSTIIEIQEHILTNKDTIKLLFSNSEVNAPNTKNCIDLVSYVHKNRNAGIDSPELQFLITNLAFYFKKANRSVYVYTCVRVLKDTILKYRLQAWYQYKNYGHIDSHVTLFPTYLETLSRAIADGHEEYLQDVLEDLHDYYSQYSQNLRFTALFNDDTLLKKYFLLREYQKHQTSLAYTFELHRTINKIYRPSEFTERLFNHKFIDYIRTHELTQWSEVILGYNREIVRSEIIRYGQADFDNAYETLTPEQVVKLYCYLNMRKHYYSSLYLFERCSWLKRIISQNGCAKFIDIGCGPATSGVALTDHLYSDNGFKHPFDYIGVDCYLSMLSAASDMMANNVYQSCSEQHYVTSINNIDPKYLDDANLIILNACYLFGSPTLKVEKLATEVNAILDRTKNLPRFLLFQNTTDPKKNTKYDLFKALLVDHDVLLSEKVTIKYNNQRHSFYTPTKEHVYFEVLKF